MTRSANSTSLHGCSRKRRSHGRTRHIYNGEGRIHGRKRRSGSRKERTHGRLRHIGSRKEAYWQQDEAHLQQTGGDPLLSNTRNEVPLSFGRTVLCR